MADLLVALAQAVCVCGLIYGAYLSIRHSNEDFRKMHERPDPGVRERRRASSAEGWPGAGRRSTDRHHVNA